MRSTWPVSSWTRTSRTGSWNGLGRFLDWRRGRWPMRSERMAVPGDTGSSSTTANGVLDLKRVTMRHCARSSLAHQS